MAVTAYRSPAAVDLSTRAVGDYVRFRCDTEAELPVANVLNGDTAFTNDTKKFWDRTGDAWVERGDASNTGGGGATEVTGVCKVWLTGTPPTGYLLCDGAAVSRTTYSALFAVISTTFGVGDGSSTFNLPNMKGRVVCGYDSDQTEFDAIGETGGAKTHTLTSTEMPAHTHVQDSHNHTQDTHTHVQNSHNHTQDSHNHTQDAHTHTQNSHNHTQDAHSHIITSQTATTGGATSYEHGVLDTSSAEAEATETTATTVATNQAATATNQNATATNQAATATNQAATATNQNATATNQAAVAVNQSTGGGGAHNNLQPYIVVNWIVKT